MKDFGKEKVDVVIVEIGGTVGDIENLPFLKTIRQFKKDIGKENVLYIHVTFIPYLKAAKELKSKPKSSKEINLKAFELGFSLAGKIEKEN